MRRLFTALSILCLSIGCQSDDPLRQNPFLLNVGFQYDINLSLPQYAALNFPGNRVVVTNAGVKGFVIYNLDNSQYFVYELSDPNHPTSDCSRMTISGITASCPCPDDTNEYNIITGQPTQGGGRYGMLPYRAVRNGNIIRVTN